VKERLLKYAKYAPIVGYPLFYVFCLAVFLPLTFPYDKLRDRVVGSFNAEQRATGGQEELQIDEMSGYRLSGARVKGVRLFSLPTEPGKPPGKIEIEEASVRYAILPALIGHSDLSFHVNAFGGEASGSYDLHGNSKSIEVELESIDIGQIDPLVQRLGMPVRGSLGGTVRLEMPDGKASKGSGAVALEIKDVSVGDGKAKLQGAIALPRVEVGTVTITGEAKDGTLKISKLAAGGKDVELQGEGRILMREMATDSSCDAQIRFKINDAYRTKNDMTKSLFGAPGSNIPALFELDPKVKQSKRADGFYGWAIRGSLGRPDFSPAGGPGGGGGPSMPMVPGFGAVAPKLGGQ
jgi:type II secretion system protein N